jgi:hypothetical protein
MAKVKLNPVMEQMRGKIGDLVFRKYEDRVIVARNPDRDGYILSAVQTDHRERFRQAAAYGKSAFADPAQKALYDAAGKARRKPAFALAVSDYLNPPVIDPLDLTQYTGQVGQPIIVRARDDFAVTAVNVTIKDNAGAVIEQGPASLELGVWRYVATDGLPTAACLDRGDSHRPPRQPNDPGAHVGVKEDALSHRARRIRQSPAEGHLSPSASLRARSFRIPGAPAAGRHLAARCGPSFAW